MYRGLTRTVLLVELGCCPGIPRAVVLDLEVPVLDDLRLPVDLIVNVSRGGWKLWLGKLSLDQAPDIFINILTNGFTRLVGCLVNDSTGF